MKSNTTGSSVKGLKKQARINRLEQAVCRTLEALEGRVLMAAGWADQSLYDPNINPYALNPVTLTGGKGYLQEDTTYDYYVYGRFDAANAKTQDPPTDLDTYDALGNRTASYIDLTSPGTGNRIIKVLTDDAGKIYVVGTRVAYQGFKGTYSVDKTPDPADPTKTIKAAQAVYGTIKCEQMYIARYLPNGELETIATYGGDYYRYIHRFDQNPPTYDFGDLGTLDFTKGQGEADAQANLDKAISDRYETLINNFSEEAVTAAIDPKDGSLAVIFQKVHVGLTDMVDYYVARYYANGMACGHNNGSNDGMVQIQFQPTFTANNGLVRDMRMLPDGSFVLAGDSQWYSSTTSGVEPVLVRYTVDPLTKAITQTKTLQTPKFKSYSEDSFAAVDVDASGRIYVVGTTDDSTWDPSNGHKHLIIQRYGADGTLDTTFGSNTQVELADFGSKNVTGIDIKVQPDGRIVVMGQLDAVPDGAGAADTTVVARFKTDGSLDTTFIGGGRAYILPAGESEWLGQSLAIQSDGGIIIVGEESGGDLEVTRLTKSGRTDTAFGANGFGFIPAGDSFVSSSTDPFGLLPAPRPTLTIDRGPNGIGDDKVLFGWTPFGDNYFDVVRLLATNKAPTSDLQAPDLYTYDPFNPAYTFVVTYTDDELVDGASIGAIGDVVPGLVVYGPDGNPVLDAGGHPIKVRVADIIYSSQPQLDANADGVDDARSITVQYNVDLQMIDPISHLPVVPQNGLYSIGIASHTVSDTDSLAPLGNVARTLGGFRVNITAPDIVGPDYNFNYQDATNTTQNDVAKGIVVGGTSYWDFHVVYTDASGVDITTIADTNIQVTGPRGYDQMASVVGTPTPIILSNGDQGFVVTYRILAPNATSAADAAHTWTVSADGIYHMTMAPAQVSDLAADPNFVPEGEIAQFNVAVSGTTNNNNTTDTLPPIAVLQQPLAKLDPTVKKYDFTVVYTDNTAVLDTSIAPSNILVSGPAGVSILVTVKSKSAAAPASSITVVYELTLQGANTWPAGRYKISLAAGQVSDAFGNTTGGNATAAPVRLGAFKVGGVTAGELDPSMDGTGSVTASQDPATIPGPGTIIVPGAKSFYGLPFAYNPQGVDYIDTTATWDGVSPFVDPETVIHGVTVDSGGRTIVVGEAMGHHIWQPNPGYLGYFDREFYVARYNSDGTLDQEVAPNTTGNLNPIVYPAHPTDLDDRAFGVVIEPDFLPDGVTPNPLAGQIVVGGTNGSGGGGNNGTTVAIARYLFTSRGNTRTLDSMDQNGYLPHCTTVTSIQLQAVGNTWMYLVVGSTYDQGGGSGQNFTMWRFKNDGTLDMTFGTDPQNPGRVVTSSLSPNSPFHNSSDDEITGVAVQKNGMIDVVGYSDDTVWNSTGGHVRMIVGQYTIAGVPDSHFGTNGFVEIGDVRTSDARGNAITIQQDGRIVVAGVFDKDPLITGPDGTPFDTGLISRLNSDGTFDNSFGTAGRLELADPAGAKALRPSQLGIQSDGKIMVVGELGDGFALARLTTDGHLDMKYGNNDGFAILDSLPTGFRETRLGNIGGTNGTPNYSYDTPVITLGAGLDVDKSVIVGNYVPTGLGALQFGGFIMARVQGDNTPPVALSQLSNVTSSGATSYSFYVTYTDNVLIDYNSVLSSAASLQIIAPNGSVLTPKALTAQDIVGSGPNVGLNYRQFVVRYTITPPGGTWDLADVGTYKLRLTQQVTDIEGLAITVPANPGYLALGNFDVLIAAPDTIAPTASIPALATDMTIAGRQTYRFQVIFNDATLDKLAGHGGNIATASLIANNNVITVRGPNNYMQNAKFISIDDSTNGVPRVVTYEITAPGGYWDQADNGFYTFSLNANQVSDDNSSANFAQAAQIGQLRVALVPGLNVFPTAALSPVSDITATQADLQFTVTYTPSANVAATVKIDPTSILNNSNAIRVHSAASAFDLMATPVSFTAIAGGAYQVVYKITPASGLWGISNNGTYTISVMPGQIHDNDAPANYVQGADLGTFSVKVADVTAPIATLGLASPIGTNSVTFSVVYSDNVAVDVSSLGNANVIVIGADGTHYPAVLVGIDLNSNGTPRVVSYRMDAPGGKWLVANNGAYHVQLQPNQVKDTAGNSATVAQDLGVAFTVAVENNVPTAQLLSNPNIAAVQATYDFTVRYTDDTAVLFSSIAAGNISVIGPNGTAYPVSLVGVNINGDGAVRDVTYRMTGPSISGKFDQTVNGVYHIQLLTNQVSDVFTNFAVAADLGTFNVTVDSVAPTASALSTPSITTAIGTNYVFTVQYKDDIAIDLTKIGDANVLVADPTGATHAVVLLTVDVSNGGKTVVATYRLAAPTASGVWDVTANGSYQIMMQAAQVADPSGNFVQAGNIGSFSVSLETQKPQATLVGGPALTLTLTPNGVPQLTYLFTVKYSDNVGISVASSVAPIDAADIRIVGPDGTFYGVTLVGVDVASDGTPRSATYSFAAPTVSGAFDATANGVYKIALQPGQVADVSGNLADPANLGTLTVANADQPPQIVSHTDNVLGMQAGTTNVVVTYVLSDDIGIDLSTIDAGDVSVQRIAGGKSLVLQPLDSNNDGIPDAPQILSVNNGTLVTITWTFLPPAYDANSSNYWEWRDNGTWRTALALDGVKDTSGQSVQAPDFIQQGGWITQVAIPQDLVAPTGLVTLAQPIYTNINAYGFDVTFADNVAVEFKSLRNNGVIQGPDIELVGPDGVSHLATLLGVNGAYASGTPIRTQYGLSGYTFTAADNGRWSIRMLSGAVWDVSGNYVPAIEIGSFNVAIDTAGPVVTVVSAPNINSPVGKYQVFTLQYTDASGVNVANIDGNDVTVTGPDGASHPAEFVSLVASTDGKTVTAIYRTAASTTSGAWDVTANGTWQIVMQANQVADALGNFTPAGIIGSFNVAFETVRPTAFLVNGSPIVVTDATLTYIDFTVSYNDNTAIAYRSIDVNDVVVIGPGSVAYPVTLVSIDQSTDGSTRLATYRFAAPLGTFGSVSNGDYTIGLQTGQVADTAGNFANAANLGTISVDVHDSVVNGVLTVSGTDDIDTVSILVAGTNYNVTVNGASHLVPISTVTKIAVLTYGGNDSVVIGPGVIGCYIDGGAGRDVLNGGQGNDTIIGGQGNDTINGGGGADLIDGKAGGDLIHGGAGDDTIVGGGGQDWLYGQAGNDVIYANDGVSDIVAGGAGVNSAIVDTIDVVSNINTFLPTGSVPPPTGPVPSIRFAASPLFASPVNVLDLVANSKLV